MRLSELLKPQNIKLGLAARNKSEAIAELVGLLASNHEVTDPKKVLDSVLEREGTRTTGIGTCAMLSIDVVNDVVKGGRLTPAHVSPVTREHGGEVAVTGASGIIAGPREVGASEGVGPSVSTVG